AFPLFIRVTLRETDGFLDFLSAITAEYCAASDEADFGFSHSQLPRPDFTRNTSFNWLPGPRHAERERLEEMECLIRCSSIDFSSPVQEAAGSDLDYEPGIV